MVESSSARLLSKRIGWLVQYYQHAKPTHRAVIQVDDHGAQERFHPGKLLDQLKKCFLPDPKGAYHQTLPRHLREQCMSLWWFQGWLNELRAKRKTGELDGPPDFEEQTYLLAANYPTTAPRKGEAVTVERLNGVSYELNGHALLEKIAPNFHGDVDDKHRHFVSQQQQQQILLLPWADEWIAIGRKRREVARMRKLVTKEMKVEFLLFFFKTRKPAWKDRIPIRVPDESGDMFDFYPGTWLDDLGDNWLAQGRPNVVLSKAQQIAIEKLPWFNDWLRTVRDQRENRANGRKRSVAEIVSDDDEMYQTDTSQQENKKLKLQERKPRSLPESPVSLTRATSLTSIQPMQSVC